MKVETRKVYDVLVVDIAGRLDSHASGEVGDRITAIVQGDDKRVLLNLAGLDFMSSAGLRVLLRGAKLSQVNSGQLKMCSPKPEVREILDGAGFNALIRIYDTEKEAFSSFERPAAAGG